MPAVPAVPAGAAEPAVPAGPAVPAEAAVPAEPAEPAVPAVPAGPAVHAGPAVPAVPARHAGAAEYMVPAEAAAPAEADLLVGFPQHKPQSPHLYCNALHCRNKHAPVSLRKHHSSAFLLCSHPHQQEDQKICS